MFQLMVACGKCFLQLNFILLFLCRFAAYIWLHIRLACCTPVLLRTRFVLFLSPPHYPELGFYYRSFSKPFAFLLRPICSAPRRYVGFPFHSSICWAATSGLCCCMNCIYIFLFSYWFVYVYIFNFYIFYLSFCLLNLTPLRHFLIMYAQTHRNYPLSPLLWIHVPSSFLLSIVLNCIW